MIRRRRGGGRWGRGQNIHLASCCVTCDGMAPSYQHTPTMKTSYFSPTLTAEGLGGIPSSASCGQHLDKLWTCPFLLSSLCDRAGKWNSFYLLSDKGVNKSSQNIILCQLEICKWRVKKTSVEISTKGGVGQTRCTLFFAKYRWHLQLSAPPSVVTPRVCPVMEHVALSNQSKAPKEPQHTIQHTIAQLTVTGR